MDSRIPIEITVPEWSDRDRTYTATGINQNMDKMCETMVFRTLYQQLSSQWSQRDMKSTSAWQSPGLHPRRRRKPSGARSRREAKNPGKQGGQSCRTEIKRRDSSEDLQRVPLEYRAGMFVRKLPKAEERTTCKG